MEQLTPKPNVQDVWAEAIESKKEKNKIRIEPLPPCVEGDSNPPFLTQMAKEYYAPEGKLFQDEMRVKTRHLEVNSLKGGYQNSGPMARLQDFENYMKAHGNRVTRRLVVSLMSSLYDPNNVASVVARTRRSESGLTSSTRRADQRQ